MKVHHVAVNAFPTSVELLDRHCRHCIIIANASTEDEGEFARTREALETLEPGSHPEPGSVIVLIRRMGQGSGMTPEALRELLPQRVRQRALGYGHLSLRNLAGGWRSSRSIIG